MTKRKSINLSELGKTFRKTTGRKWAAAGVPRGHAPQFYVCLECFEDVSNGWNKPYESLYTCAKCATVGFYDAEGYYTMELTEALEHMNGVRRDALHRMKISAPSAPWMQ